MPLVNGLPLNIFPGAPWSATAPQQVLELITTYHLQEKMALSQDPGPDLAWAEVGSEVAQGVGIAKFPHVLPQTLNFRPFKPGGTREYHSLDAVAKSVYANPFDLSFGIPMIWNEIGNGWQLMSQDGDGALIPFLGIGDLGAQYVLAGRAWKCQLIASLFYEGMYCAALGLTSPKARTYPQPNNPDGIALLTDGTGADGSGGAQHYAHPTNAAVNGRYKNLWTAFGSFDTKYGESLVKMTIKPHSTLANVTTGARVTDVFGPTFMREKFWKMAVQELVLETATVGGNGVAAATTNPYSIAKQMGVSQENFVGNAFGPRKYWILPQLDNHPYCLANPGKDMWFNVSAGTNPLGGGKMPSWAKLACNSKDFVPVFRMYGPGDPRAMNERRMRFEGDLDAGADAGVPYVIDGFFEV